MQKWYNTFGNHDIVIDGAIAFAFAFANSNLSGAHGVVTGYFLAWAQESVSFLALCARRCT